jgi:hypothetical protein
MQSFASDRFLGETGQHGEEKSRQEKGSEESQGQVEVSTPRKQARATRRREAAQGRAEGCA